VAIDIGSHAVKVVELSTRGGEARMANFGVVPLPPESIVDSEVMDRELVVESIQNLFEKKGIRNRRVVSAVGGRGVIVKRIRMAAVDEDQAPEAIRLEAEQHVPYDMDDVSFDYQILPSDAGPREMEVLLVAAKRERISDHAQLLREAGLLPVAIDLHAFAVQTATEWNHEFIPEDVLALVNIGAELTNIHIVRSGVPLYTQDVSTGGNDFVRAVQKNFQCTRDEALAALRGPHAAGEEKGTGGADFDLTSLLEEFCGELSGTLEKSLLYLQTSNENVERLNRIFLSGGSAMIQGLREVLGRIQEAPVEVVNPLKRIQYAPEAFGSEDPMGFAPQLTVGVGLALRKGRGA
jgi:type IV pilus assembly protein PilM